MTDYLAKSERLPLSLTSGHATNQHDFYSVVTGLKRYRRPLFLPSQAHVDTVRVQLLNRAVNSEADLDPGLANDAGHLLAVWAPTAPVLSPAAHDAFASYIGKYLKTTNPAVLPIIVDDILMMVVK